MKYAVAVLATLTVLGLLALVFPYTGIYNVAASAGHTSIVRWYLDTLSERSIKARSGNITPPEDLGDSLVIRRGAVAFADMCRTCHGAPGAERSPTGKGMTPEPPSLSEAASEWSAPDIYWILQHGIKMAGMPAYGPTHSEEELWEIVAFVQQLPEMTPERYATLTADRSSSDSTSAMASDGHDHVH